MSRGHSIYHFATRNDYSAIFADVASKLAVKYVVDEWHMRPEDFRVYSLPFEAPDFALFKWPKDSPAARFLILPVAAELPFKYHESRQVPEKYGFMPTQIGYPPNYPFVFFDSSGFHKSEEWGEGMLQGWINTNSIHPDSIAIFNAFKKSIKNRFEYFRFSGVYVGHEAAAYFDAGGRLSNHDLRRRENDIRRV